MFGPLVRLLHLQLLTGLSPQVLLWRPVGDTADAVHARLPEGAASLTALGGERWLRHVAANPGVDVAGLWAAVEAALGPE